MSKNTARGNHRPDDWMHQSLFDQAPFNIAIIDRDYNIVAANGHFGDYFGRWRNKKCYEVYKNLDAPCLECRAQLTFQDGKARVSSETGIDHNGEEAHYVAHLAPLQRRRDAPIDHIVHMSRDVVESRNWQKEYQLLFERVPCYITVIDRNFKIVRANENFRETFGDVHGRQCYEVYKKRETRCPNCPAARTFRDGQVHHSGQVGIKKRGEKAHYMLTTSPLGRDVNNVVHVIEISTDITATKKLEKEIIEAERLAAVGQTVAGLAHSIKNILMGLEGGMYVVKRGLKKDDKEIVDEGWQMLERNLTKTTSLVRDFLSFAKGRLPKLEPIDPNTLVREIVELYRPIAAEVGVDVKAKYSPKIHKAPLDPKGIHTCLTNLVSNAIDACRMSDKKDGRVVVAVSETKAGLVYRVSDNGMGMDYDIKSKVFTTFFTTKGGQGTGLGLLTTRKIVKEHGGKIDVSSKKGEGSQFRLTFPRKRLNTLFEEQSQ